MTGVVLLTGATGFVGRQLLRVLEARGIMCRCVVRAGKQGMLQGRQAIEPLVVTPDLFAEGAAWWAEACRGVDTVIHAAWYAEPGKYLQSAINRECLNGTLALAEGAARAGVRRFVGLGTCFEYDLSVGTLPDDAPLRPLTPYAEAKAAVFRALTQRLPAGGVEFAWCRLFYLHGEGEDSRRLVSYLRAMLASGKPALLGAGDRVRDYLDVGEAARMIVDAALGTRQGAINICSGMPVTVRQVAERIADEYGRRDLLRFGARADNPDDPPYVLGVRSPT